MWFKESILILLLLCFSSCLLASAGLMIRVRRAADNDYPLQTISEHDQAKSWQDEPQTYGVIVDCGSSGTRAHIYQWDTKLDYPELLHDIAPMYKDGKPVSKKFEPGLSSLADASIEEMHDYIRPLIEYVLKHIPEDRLRYTVIYVLATAGMRLLDEETQDKIMEEVKNYVRKLNKFKDITSSVISGAAEGMYRWISVNAKAKRFLEPDTDKETKTFAIIEMGGASTQVVYQLRPYLYPLIRDDLRREDTDRIWQIYKKQVIEPQMSRDHSYQLHSTTFLGFGGDSAHEAYLDLLIRKRLSIDLMQKMLNKASNLFYRITSCVSCEYQKMTAGRNMLTIRDPCAPKGFWSNNAKKPRQMMKSTEKTIGFIADDDDIDTFSLLIIGTGNYNKCKKYVEQMLKTAKKERLNCKPKEFCTMELLGEKFVPFHATDFIGLGDIYHTTNTMIDMDGPYIRSNIIAKTKNICEMPMWKLERTYSDVANSKFEKVRERIHGECFRAVWVDTFLVKGLMMPEDYGQLKTKDKINDEDPEWTLGAVLDKSLAIHDEITEGSDYLPKDDDTPAKSNEETDAGESIARERVLERVKERIEERAKGLGKDSVKETIRNSVEKAFRRSKKTYV